MISIRPVSEIERYLKILVYGDPGVGKTVLAATCEQNEQMSKTLIVNIEGGVLSVSGSGAEATEQVKNVDDVEQLMWHLAQRTEGYEKYKTVVIDSGTELQTLDIEGIVQDSIKRKGTKDRSIDDVHIEDYGKSTARLKRIFRHIRDLPMNVVVTALVKRVMPQTDSKNRSRTPIIVMPQFTEKLAGSLMGYMDAVWYMYKEGDKRLILTQTEGAYLAKTRGMDFSTKIGKVVENPNLAELYQTLLETEGQR